MPVNHPHAKDLIEAVREMLSDHILPDLDDPAKVYNVRVAIHTLALAERELAFSQDQIEKERQSLTNLLGHEGDIDALNAELVKNIHAGRYDEDPQALLEHFKDTVLDKIAIDNPRYPTYRQYLETSCLKV